MTRSIPSICLLLLTTGWAAGQYVDREPTLSGILKTPEPLQWDHSFSVSAASSTFGFSSQSLYMSHLTWQLAAPLQLKLDLGLAQTNWPGGMAGESSPRFVGGGELSWRPTDNTLFRFSLYRGPLTRSGWYHSPGFIPYDYSTQQ